MHVLVSGKNVNVSLKKLALEWSQHFSHYTSMGIFSNGQGQLTGQSVVGSGRNSKSVKTLWLSLLPAKKGARVFTTSNINFSAAEGQITPESVVVSGRNLNSSKLLCMPSLHARMKMIHSKHKELEWSQHFPIISLWGFFKTLKGS